MTEEQKDMAINIIKYRLSDISYLAVDLDASELINKQEYLSEDLLNATQIFSHILWNISTAYFIRKWMNEEQLWVLATEMWESLKQTIYLNTGIDIPSLCKRLYK